MVYDTSDPDWTLVGVNAEYGFAPANYIEVIEQAAPLKATLGARAGPALPERPVETESEGVPTPNSPSSPVQGPAAALAGILHQHKASTSANPQTLPSPPAITLPPRRPMYTPEESEDEDTNPPPALPRRPPSQQVTPPQQLSTQAQ